MAFTPHGTDRLVGATLGMRRWLPLEGGAGGLPGACTRFTIERAGGASEEVPTHVSGVVLEPGDVFRFLCAGGGGFGDPLDRPLEGIAEDLSLRRLEPAEAESVYGVVFGPDAQPDPSATEARRAALRRERLAAAEPPTRPISPDHTVPSGESLALYPGVVNRWGVAVAEVSGSVLALAPDHWTDGCPVLVERRPEGGPHVVTRSYLDPATGSILYAEVALAGTPRGFSVDPHHWHAHASKGASTHRPDTQSTPTP